MRRTPAGGDPDPGWNRGIAAGERTVRGERAFFSANAAAAAWRRLIDRRSRRRSTDAVV